MYQLLALNCTSDEFYVDQDKKNAHDAAWP